MITKTIGTGGDFATYYDAVAWLLALGPLSDDISFYQISDTLETLASDSI